MYNTATVFSRFILEESDHSNKSAKNIIIQKTQKESRLFPLAIQLLFLGADEEQVYNERCVRTAKGVGRSEEIRWCSTTRVRLRSSSGKYAAFYPRREKDKRADFCYSGLWLTLCHKAKMSPRQPSCSKFIKKCPQTSMKVQD